MPLQILKGKNFQKIKELILKSNLPLIDQNELIAAFARTNDLSLKGVLKLFTEDNLWIKRISENYKAKREALTAGNYSMWQKIVKEEESQLQELER